MDDALDYSQSTPVPDTQMDEVSTEKEMAELLITMDNYTPIVISHSI